MKILQKCLICNELAELRTHLRTHGLSSKDYYDLYIGNNNGCKICGKETSFKSVNEGYRIFCSNKCRSLDEELEKKRIIKFKQNPGTEKKKETWKNKTVEEIEKINVKIRKKIKEKYGEEYFSKTETWKNSTPQKISEGLKETYKNNPEIRIKALETAKDRYLEMDEEREKITNIAQIKKIKNEIRNSLSKRYGGLGFGSEIIQNKIKESHFLKYGEDLYHDPNIIRGRNRLTYDGLSFDSIPELAYFIFLKEHEISFEFHPKKYFEYEYNGELRKYFPDFIVEGKIKEIKGLQFFENKDPNGKMINPYDRSLDDLYEAKHQCMLKNNVEIITDYEVYVKYVEEKYTKDFLYLFENNLPFPFLNEDLKDTSDYGLIQHFHKSIFFASRHNKKSPFEAWMDKELVKKSALNRLRYKGSCKPSDIIQGFNVAKIAPKVSVFKPSLAKHIIETYLSEYETIFDPFSGFSGRMLGSCACGKKYIGQDINEEHVKESNEIIKYKNFNSSIIKKDIFESEGEYECLFTCPPYSYKEIWNNDETDKTCDEWIDECLKRFKCKRYVFVVDRTEKYKNKIVETIENKSHFGKNNEFVLVI